MESKSTIQWFPGHMTKAKRQMEQVLPSCDMVIELRDSRAPFSSANPLIAQVTHQKLKLIILTKADLCDLDCLARCKQQLSNELTHVIAIDSLHQFNKKLVIEQCMQLMKPKHDKQRAKGIKPRAIRALVCGIPNVGKSTFINQMKGKRSLVVENRPGVTQSITWIKVDNNLELCDTPGMLWPKFENNKIAYHLALINAVKQSICDTRELAMEGMRILQRYYPETITQRYAQFDASRPFESIGEGAGRDIEGAYSLFLTDLNQSKFGRVSYEGHLHE